MRNFVSEENSFEGLSSARALDQDSTQWISLYTVSIIACRCICK